MVIRWQEKCKSGRGGSGEGSEGNWFRALRSDHAVDEMGLCVKEGRKGRRKVNATAFGEDLVVWKNEIKNEQIKWWTSRGEETIQLYSPPVHTSVARAVYYSISGT